MEPEQMLLDTTSSDISSAYVQTGRAGTPGHLKAAGKDAGEGVGMDVPTNYVLNELAEVFEQLGRGDLDPNQRGELTRRAAAYLAQLRQGGQIDQEYVDDVDYFLVQADISDDQRKAYAAKGQAMPDGSYPIPNVSYLKKAIKAFGRAGNKAAVKRWIIKRARALGQLSLIPDNWDAAQKPATASEQPLDAYLILAKEGDLAPSIVQEPSPQTNGIMKLRVPFYVGGSVATASTLPGMKLHFGADKLDGIIQAGRERIGEGKQPITVYARHAHALSADKLPVGRVTGLERQGDVGYVIEEIAPTTDGRDVQILARNGMLNAVSLRAGADSYTLEPITINGEDAWDVDLLLDGVDFAPDGPAQPTYGIEVLAAEARVMPKISEQRSERLPPDVLTLEAVKRDHPVIVQAIEAPLKDANAQLTQELEKVKSELTQATEALTKANDQLGVNERDAYIRELAGQFPEPDKAIGVIQEVCKDIKTKDAIAAKVMPLLLDALKGRKVEPPKPTEPPKNPFLELFPNSGGGSVLGLENLSGGDKGPKGEVVNGLEVPA